MFPPTLKSSRGQHNLGHGFFVTYNFYIFHQSIYSDSTFVYSRFYLLFSVLYLKKSHKSCEESKWWFDYLSNLSFDMPISGNQSGDLTASATCHLRPALDHGRRASWEPFCFDFSIRLLHQLVSVHQPHELSPETKSPERSRVESSISCKDQKNRIDQTIRRTLMKILY